MADHTSADTSHDNGGFEVLIAGAGVAGLEAAFALKALDADAIRVKLLTATDEFVYRPMAVGEPFRSGWAERYRLETLAAEAEAELVHGGLASVDPDRRIVLTADGDEIAYDALLVCLGASLHPRYEHVTTVDDSRIDELLHGLVQDVEEGYVKRLGIVIPAPIPWPLPAYELALMCSERAWDMQGDMTVTVVTPEEAPLAVFGREASLALSRLLAERRIDVLTSSYAEVPKAKTVSIHPSGVTVEFDRVIALPELRGPTVAGLPHDTNGFVPIDEVGRVRGVERVWAAGDATDFPIKFGGVAAQLADTAAQSIAAAAGTATEPAAFEPDLEGVLLTGGTPRFVHGRPAGGHGDESALSKVPSGARPAKIAARYLAPHLGEPTGSRAQVQAG
jgi:sulfide:quinone oxidoreductase